MFYKLKFLGPELEPQCCDQMTIGNIKCKCCLAEKNEVNGKGFGRLKHVLQILEGI